MDSPLRDDIDNFHLDREKILLDSAGSSEDESLEGISEDDMEVLPLDDPEQYYVDESEEDSDGSELGTKAWGSSKKAFYSQQEVVVSSSDEADELEEKEAIELQDKMAATLAETDFLSVASLGPSAEDQEITDEHVPLDLSKLADEDKLTLIERTCPELRPLIESFRASFSHVVQSLLPQLESVSEDVTKQLLELKLHLNLCYCVNVMFYLLMKSSNENTQSHPVISRILSLKQLISQVDNIDPTLVTTAPQGHPHPVAPNKPTEVTSAEDPLAYYERVKEAKRQAKIPKLPEKEDELEFEEEGEKRPISYQISRNKGLTPRRSKEQRNPRVKHRKKFKKALQRRKGQVLPVQTEMTRYGGETSGIRSNVARSVKIK